MDISSAVVPLLLILMIFGVTAALCVAAFVVYRARLREQKNYERSLKMVPILIHLPPPSEDIKVGGRDTRDVADEMISQAQTMYNVILSTATRGFKSSFYGQRHMSFEIVAHGGLIHYYAVVPTVLIDAIKQAIIAAYPTAQLEEVEELNLFNPTTKISGVSGGEFVLANSFEAPIATYKETKRDATGAILNAFSAAQRGDGLGLQILLRPAKSGWVKSIETKTQNIREGKKDTSAGSTGLKYFGQIFAALWQPPSAEKEKEKEKGPKPLNGVEQARVEAMEEKARYAGYEVKIRLIASCPNLERSRQLVGGVVSAFALFNSPNNNSFKFKPMESTEQFATNYIMRFFPQEDDKNILNTIELASIFHLPDQTNVPSTQVERQHFKEVDGPALVMDKGLLLGYNIYRGRKKAIRLGDNDRRRHIYVMGATGMGKSVFLENLALQDMVAGKGFAFIDPHGDSAEKLLSMVPSDRIDDVIYFNPSDMDNPIGMNLFEIDPNDPDPERTQDYIIAETMNMLYSLYDPQHQGIVGPRMANIVRNAALLLMADPKGGTFMDIPKVLVDPDFAKPKIKYLKNQRAIDFWTKEWPNAQRSNDAGEVTSWVVSKWADFENTMMSNILGQVHSTVNLRKVMDEGKILLVNLSKGKLGEMPAKLLGMVFVMKFQAAAMSRANIPEAERRDFCLFVDEFQNFATDSFESILSEARKYRLSLTVANQFVTQLTDKIRAAIMGNTGSFIIGRVGSEDAENIVKLFAPVFDTEDLQYMPNYTAAVKMLLNGSPTSPFSLRLPPPMGHPNEQLADKLRQLSAMKYGIPRAQVEAEIRARLSVTPAASDKHQDKNSDGKSSFLGNWLEARADQLRHNSTSAAQSKPSTTKPARAPHTANNAQSTQPVQSVPLRPAPAQPAPQMTPTPQAMPPRAPMLGQYPPNMVQQPVQFIQPVQPQQFATPVMQPQPMPASQMPPQGYQGYPAPQMMPMPQAMPPQTQRAPQAPQAIPPMPVVHSDRPLYPQAVMQYDLHQQPSQPQSPRR